MKNKIKFLDCTLRDGGYYNNWDFSQDLIQDYINAMAEIGVNYLELGFRTNDLKGFKGICAHTNDKFLNNLKKPKGIKFAVMINASEIVGKNNLKSSLKNLFPNNSKKSPVDLVRIACHLHEFEDALPAANVLNKMGFKIGFNLMQIANRSENEVKNLALKTNSYPVDVLYFADSMGSMNNDHTKKLISWFSESWKGEIGIHTHDNMSMALSNTLTALKNGVTWVDSTVTGMGRGPGNAKTEELAIEVSQYTNKKINIIPTTNLINNYFLEMKNKFGWGTNPFYYLAGKNSIHPTYVQKMLSDPRYSSEDLIAVLENLNSDEAVKFKQESLENARHIYHKEPVGKLNPTKLFKNKNVLILGTGPSITKFKEPIEEFIKTQKPVVIALNTKASINNKFIDLRMASHPIRIIADAKNYSKVAQPFVLPFTMLRSKIKDYFSKNKVHDYGIQIKPGKFKFDKNSCVIPSPLVAGYALAAVTSGEAKQLFLCGFDGYGADDSRTKEMIRLLDDYKKSKGSMDLQSITPTKYNITTLSLHGL